MLNQKEILSTIEMIDQQHLDIRTITMGISLLSCCDPDPKRACEKIYDKITRYAEKLVKTGEDIEREFGIPIVNKRISVTPMALVAGASETEDCVPFALALDRVPIARLAAAQAAPPSAAVPDWNAAFRLISTKAAADAGNSSASTTEYHAERNAPFTYQEATFGISPSSTMLLLLPTAAARESL